MYYQFLHNTSSPVTFLQLNTLKGITKAPTVDLLRQSTLRGTKPGFLTSERYDEHPRPFHVEVPPRIFTCLHVYFVTCEALKTLK